MFSADYYDTGTSPDTSDYRSIVLDQRKRSTSYVIILYAAPPLVDPIEREILPFQVLQSYNTVVGLEAKQ
jgi:hypothetical protein